MQTAREAPAGTQGQQALRIPARGLRGHMTARVSRIFPVMILAMALLLARVAVGQELANCVGTIAGGGTLTILTPAK